MSIAGKVIGYLGSVFGLYPRSGGGIVVRQPGGTAGTHEVQTYHDGTDGSVQSMAGTLRLLSGNTIVMRTSSANRWAIGAWIQGYVDGRISWGPNAAYGSDDTSICRTAAGVVGFLNGSSAGRTFSSPVLTPSQITSNQDNYAPGVAMHYRLSTDASRDITGLSVGQVDGQVCEIWNVGSNNIVLKHDVTSTAANRFLCVGSADLTLVPNDIALLRYDPTSQRWRVGKL